ncbi:MAG: peptide deformylase [Candidatus Omnitrophica bacterium]|nr:peptide deformylase [Candidatus Omnitrophota bacterium]
MSPLEIKKYPDKILREACESVESVTKKERKIFDEMLFTMRHFCGIGLAAPQVGISRRLIVASVEDVTIKLANPEILDTDGSDMMSEGCLSVINTTVDIKRPATITVKGLNEEGKMVELKAGGLLARVLQHEIDHLNGRLIIDYMSIFRRLKFKVSCKKG